MSENENIKEIIYYQRLPFILKIVQTKLISSHHNNPLADHFDIDKIKELIS